MGQNNYVLDVNIYASYIIGKKLFQLIRLSETGLQIYTSDKLLAELADVLSRPKIKKYLSTPVSNYISIIENFTEVVSSSEFSKLKISSPDKDDDYLFELALHTESVLVTGDKQLLYWKRAPLQLYR